MTGYRRSVSSASGKKTRPEVSGGGDDDEKPPLLHVYGVQLPRERSQTLPAIDYHLWKARNSLLSHDDSDSSGLSQLQLSSGCSSLAASRDGLCEQDVFPAALCAYGIPLPLGPLRPWEETVEMTSSGRRRSISMPASDLKKLLNNKILEANALVSIHVDLPVV